MKIMKKYIKVERLYTLLKISNEFIQLPDFDV